MLQQVDNPVGQSLLAEHDVQVSGGCDLLETALRMPADLGLAGQG